MQDLDIKISKARLTGFTVDLSNDSSLPTVTATILLLTGGGKSITTYCIASRHYNDDQKFDLPADMIPPIVSMSRTLERIVADHCQSSAKAIEHKIIDPDEIPL